MASKISDYSERITIQHRPTITLDRLGNPVRAAESDWVTFASVWAKELPAMSNESVAQNIQLTNNAPTFEIRWLDGVTETMRVIHRERTFYISGLEANRAERIVTIQTQSRG
jgi:SPP1 family predicted phage head-tail adaptor